LAQLRSSEWMDQFYMGDAWMDGARVARWKPREIKSFLEALRFVRLRPLMDWSEFRYTTIS